MENMRNKFLDVVVYLLFFAVQSSQGLTAIITPNKTEFVFVSGMKPSENITCESDCGIYNWSCTYSWITSKNRERQIYIEKNNSLINTASKENVTLWCFVENGSGVSEYSRSIKIFLIDTPRNITIRSYGDIDDLQEGQGYINISCNADCNPECDRYQIYHNGVIFNASKDTRITKDRRNSGRYQCAASNSVSNRFQNSTNSVYIDIKYAPSNVSIIYSSDNGDMQEGNGYINISCNADCNPECVRYFIYHNGREEHQTKVWRIKKDRINSGLYKCEALNSLSRSVSNTINISIHYTTVILESNVKEMTINIRDILPGSVSCRIDCNFPGCNSEIIVKRNSQPYRTIQSRYSIFENRKANHSDDGTYVCMVGNRMSENNFELIIYHGPRTASVLRNNQNISGDIIEKEDNSMTIFLRCSSSCNPPCKIAWYKDGQLDPRDNPVIDITLDRRMSGVYHCEASGVEGTVKSDPVHVIIQYKPKISSAVDQTTITAPNLLHLTFSVDSFPSSNVTIFHKTKRQERNRFVTFIPNVTGQLSFNVSIESCLDQGEYRIEAVNVAGSDSFTLIANVKCSPIVVRYSNVSQKEFRVGDLLHLTVSYMVNPTAEVLWSFVPWNKNTSLVVQRHQIQNHKESTKIVLILSDTDKFGKYKLELKNELGNTSHEFDIQGPRMAATKTDLGTTISSRDSDSHADLSMSPTSWKGKARAIREVEMNTFLLQQDKLQEEVQKLRIEGDVLRLMKNYYVIKLQLLMKDHSDVIDEILGED